MNKKLKVPIYFHLRADLADAMERHLKKYKMPKTEYLNELIEADLSFKVELLKTEKDYKYAVNYLEMLGDLPEFQDSPYLIERFETIKHLIKNYENEKM